jgi:hypothetical protein
MVLRIVPGYDNGVPLEPKEERMAKKTVVKTKEIKHARIELSPEDHELVKDVAKSMGLGVTAYVRMAVLQRARKDSAEASAGKGHDS